MADNSVASLAEIGVISWMMLELEWVQMGPRSEMSDKRYVSGEIIDFGVELR